MVSAAPTRAALCVAIVAMIAGGCTGKPHVKDVERAIAAGDLKRAHTLLASLEKTSASAPDVLAAKDDLTLAEAKQLTGEARFAALDEVAARGGARAAEARDAARTERLAFIRKAIAARTPEGAAAAIAAIDHGFPGWKTDAEVAEERARAFDLEVALCADDPCRLGATRSAAAAAPTPERTARITPVRVSLVTALAVREVKGEPPLVRLRRLRALGALAAKTHEASGDDAELSSAAKDAAGWAQAERGKVPLLGNETDIAAELLGADATTSGKTPAIATDGVSIYLSLDAQKKCRGIYAVGATKDARAIHGATWTGDQLLSQAVGHQSSIKAPLSDSDSATKMNEGGTAVVARWKAGQLIELRIGDAAP